MTFIIVKYNLVEVLRPFVLSNIMKLRYTIFDILGYIDTFFLSIYPLYIKRFIDYYIDAPFSAYLLPKKFKIAFNPKKRNLIYFVIEIIITWPFLPIIFILYVFYSLLTIFETIKEKKFKFI